MKAPAARRARSLAVAIALGLAAGSAARAGQTCKDTPIDAQSVVRGMALATATARALDASGAQVVMLARAG